MINEIIRKYLENQSQIEGGKHKKSGLLSPSKFANTTQVAVLQMLEVPADPPDDRLLRIWERGHQIEAYLVSTIEKATSMQATTQEKVEYKKAIGLYDFIWNDHLYEVKSVSCNRIRRIKKENEPQLSHAIQTTFYLLATGRSEGTIIYIVPDTLEIKEFTIKAEAYKSELDLRIIEIYNALYSGTIPDHQAREDWHDKQLYSNYPEFWNKTGKECIAIIKDKYPKSFELLNNKEWREKWNTSKLIHSEGK